MSAEAERRGRFRGMVSRTFPHAKDMIELLFGAILMFVGIVGCVLIQEQLNLMWFQTAIMQQQLIISERDKRSTSKDTERLLTANENLAKASKDAAAAELLNAQNSERIAKASESSIEATRESLRFEQRAWVGVRGLKNIAFEAGKPAGATIVVINSGRTPALEMHGQIVLEYLPVGTEPFTNWPPAEIGLLESNQVLNPSAESEMQRYTKLPITESYAESIRLRRTLVYARAKIFYNDVFGRQHQTTYCGRLNYDRTQFEFGTDGNDAD